jgi:tripartite-type tricarboxylate transporter receptor subunit TctC
MIDPIPAALPHVRDGRLLALAVTSPKRVAAAPEVPTAAESGMPGLEVLSWYGVWGPQGMAAATVERLNRALAQGMAEPDVGRRLAPLGLAPVAESAADFARYIALDVARNTELLRAANFQPE